MLSSNRIAPEEYKLPEEASTEEVREESPEASAAAAAEDIVEEELRARAVLDARWLPDPCVASLFAASYCPLSYQHSVHDCACMRVCLRACTRGCVRACLRALSSSRLMAISPEGTEDLFELLGHSPPAPSTSLPWPWQSGPELLAPR